MKEEIELKVECKICGKKFKNLSSLSRHIFQAHKVKIEEYYLQFIGKQGKCLNCGKDTKYLDINNGYRDFCSCRCSTLYEGTKEKTKKTNMIKYGVEYASQYPENRKKFKETCNEKYDCDNPMQYKEFKEKCQQTCFENNGVYIPFKSPEIIEKSKETCNEKYGVDNYTKTEEFKERYVNTCNERYNVDNYFKTNEFLIKSKETCNERYNVDFYTQTDEFKQKSKETTVERYGVDNYSKTEEFIIKSETTCLEKYDAVHPMKNKEISDRVQESILNNNNGRHPSKLTYKQVQERYPDLVKIEGLIEGPNGEIWGHCKNSNCKNSRENGGYFDVSKFVGYRNDGINANDTGHFYCSENCKHTCILYGRSAIQLHNLINENPEIPYTQEEYSTWKNEVFHRQRIENNADINFCEYCHATEDLHVHHEVPQKIVPGYALDPDNGIIACEKCHYEKGHATGTECSTGNLANKICK